MFFVKILFIICWFIFVPLILGNKLTQERTVHWCNICLSYIFGWVKMMALFQLFAVPATFLKLSLTSLITIWCIFVLGGVIFYLYHNRKEYIQIIKSIKIAKKKIYLLEVLALLLVILQLLGVTFFASADADDAFYVSSAVTAEHTDTIFRYVGDVGMEYEQFPLRYVMSPFPIFIATLSRLIQIQPTIVAHTILPLFFIPLCYMVYYLLLKELMKGDRKKIALGMCFGSILTLFSNISVYTASTFLMIRIWQGKAVLANILIPFLIYLLLCLYRHLPTGKPVNKWGIFVTMLASCMVSSMGIFLTPLMLAIYSVCYFFKNRNIRFIVQMFFLCAPNMAYGIWYLILLKLTFGAIPTFR